LLATSLLAVAACQSAKDPEIAPAASSAPVPAAAPDTPATAPADTQPGVELVLVPGKSLGPISLDMEEKDLRALGLEVRSRAEGLLDVGPYLVTMKDGRVESAAVGFSRYAKTVVIGDKKIDRTMRLEAAAATIGDCAPATDNIGASIIECRGGTIELLRGGRSETITSVGVAKAK
jgi:hypothetical protein